MSDEHNINSEEELENHHDHHHHDHDHHHDEEEQTIILSLDDNTELECHVLGIFDCDNQKYMALLPFGEEDVFIYRYQEGEDGGPILDLIENDDEYDKVGQTFYDILEEKEEDTNQD